MMFGLFGCSGARAVVYRPDPKAEVASCAVLEVTDVKLGKPVSPSMVKPDSWLTGTVVDHTGIDDTLLRIDFESLTNLKPAVGETWRVHLNGKGDAVKLEAVPPGTRCGA